MPKTTKKEAEVKPDIPFEEALGRLESLVQGMESDQVPLEDLIKNYEEGIALYRVCEKRLDEAQGRIEIIRKKRNGNVEIEPFENVEQTKESSDQNVKSTAKDEGKLL